MSYESRKQITYKTHDAVSVAASSFANSNWYNVSGFDEARLTLQNDAATSSSLDVYWSHDGVNIHGFENVIASSTSQWKAGSVKVKASYMRVTVNNGDTVAHTMSAFALLTT